MGKIVIEGEVTCGKLFLCNRYLSVPNGGSTKPQETFVATEVWAAYMDMSGSILGMEWWPITGAIFPWKVWKNGAVGRPQPVRDIRGGSAGCSQEEFRQIRTKRKDEKNENLPSYEK